MKKKYTKRQIQESIAYWKKQLNENISYSGNIYNLIDEVKETLKSLNFYVDDLENKVNANDIDIERIQDIVQNLSLQRDELNRFFGM